MRMSAQDEARKTRVATFPGEHYSAEHEEGNLHVYAHTDEHGIPARRFGAEQGTSGIRSTAGDARPGRVPHAESPLAPRTPADLRRIHEQHFAALRRA
jgi:hypothetical protein